MKIAAGILIGRDRHVDLLALIAVLQLGLSGLLFHFGEILKDPVLKKVHVLAEIGFLVLGNVAHFLHQRVHFTRFAVQILLAKLIDAAGVGAAFGFFQEFLPDLIKPAHNFSF